jgi:hypothetical protein
MVSFIILISSVRIRIKAESFYIPVPVYRIKKLIPPLAVLFPFTGIIILAISLDVPKYLSTLADAPSTFYEEYYITGKKEESYSYFRRISRNRFSDN